MANPSPKQFDESREDSNVYQLRMDLEMKAQKLGYEAEAFDHIMEAEESDVEVDEEQKESEISSAIDQELQEVVERQLDKVLGDKENPFESQVSDEFEGDVSAVRHDPGGSNFMQPDVFSENMKFFLSLFSNRFASQIKRGEQNEWRDTSRYHYLSDEEIMESLSGESGIQRAFRSDATTRFLVITLNEDCYYRLDGMTKLKACLSEIGIESVKLYKASDVEDLHMYVFLDKPTRADLITKSVSAWMRRAGIVPGTAGVDLFPGGGALSIPLQPGFEFLNEKGLVIASRKEISLEASLALFLNDMTRSSVCGMKIIEKVEELTRQTD